MMNRLLCLISGLLLLLSPPMLGRQVWQRPAEEHRLIVEASDCSMKQEYRRADSLFELCSKKFPSSPAGFIYRAALLQTKALDLYEPVDVPRFDSLITKAIVVAELMPERQPDVLWKYFFLGTAYGLQAFYHSEEGQWFGAIQKGFAGASEFQRILAVDSTFIDAFVGVGTFAYWKSQKTEFLHWLPFVNDERELGIRMVERCADSGIYNRYTAINSLVTIFLDAKEYDRAIRWSERVLAQYPSNRIFLKDLASAYQKKGDFARATQTYTQLLRCVLTDTMKIRYAEIATRYNLAKCALAAGDTSVAQGEFRALLSLRIAALPQKLKERAAPKFSEANSTLLQLEGSKASHGQ